MSENSTPGLLAALADAERRRRDTQRLSGVGFWELHHKERTLYWSEEIFSIYGLAPNALEPSYEIFTSLIHDEDRELVEIAYQSSVETGTEYNIRYRIKTGDLFKWIEARGVTYYDTEGSPDRSIGTAQDISEIIDAQKVTEHLATHDALTGLPNRKLFSDRISEAVSLAKRNDSTLGVLFIDLDNFKLINDRHGHDIGDEVLMDVAKRLEHSARDSDTFARIGGDEFVGLISGIAQPGISSGVERVKDAIDGVYETRKGKFNVTTSIGVTIYPQDGEEPDALLRQSDHAMYEAKETGKSRICYFDSRRHRSNLSRQQLLLNIEHAIDNDQFVLHFQPRVSLSDGTLSGAEALLRWFHPDGPTPPSEVIKAIGGTPLEWELDAWVVQAVIAEIERFHDHGLRIPVSFNVSPSTIENSRFPSMLGRLIDSSEISGQNLEIEILEISSIRNFDRTNEILRLCKKLGVSFSLDDFGTGYASLTHFHSLPVDKLKIDRRFILSLLSEAGSLELVKSILAIAQANDCPVVAEGVESYAVAHLLRQLGCDFGQGFGLARPMASNDFIAWGLNWNGKAFLDKLDDSG